jgi:hypothetical protein
MVVQAARAPARVASVGVASRFGALGREDVGCKPPFHYIRLEANFLFHSFHSIAVRIVLYSCGLFSSLPQVSSETLSSYFLQKTVLFKSLELGGEFLRNFSSITG